MLVYFNVFDWEIFIVGSSSVDVELRQAKHFCQVKEKKKEKKTNIINNTIN